MTAIVDQQFRTLRALGYTGSTSDMVLQWLRASGATSKNINDAWMQLLALLGYTGGTRNDLWFAYLTASGYPGKTLNDKEHSFWGLGPNLATNGTFTGSAAPWALGAGWVYSANTVVTFPAAVSTDVTLVSGSFLNGKTYRVSFVVSSYSSGTLTPEFFGSALNAGTPVSENGSHVQYITISAATITEFRFNAAGPFAGAIDNVVIKEVQ